MERPLFVRERLNHSYETLSYFLGKSLSEFPFHIWYCTVFVLVAYFAIGLNYDTASSFFT